MKYYKNIFSSVFICFIRIYQLVISPLFPASCRFYPTCSEYGVKSIRKFGLLKGSILLLKRISKCHPFGGSGKDLVP